MAGKHDSLPDCSTTIHPSPRAAANADTNCKSEGWSDTMSCLVKKKRGKGKERRMDKVMQGSSSRYNAISLQVLVSSSTHYFTLQGNLGVHITSL